MREIYFLDGSGLSEKFPHHASRMWTVQPALKSSADADDGFEIKFSWWIAPFLVLGLLELVECSGSGFINSESCPENHAKIGL